MEWKNVSRRGRRLLVVVAALAALGFVSCSKKAKKVELNFLEVMGAPARTEALKQFISEYEAARANVTINLISPPYEQSDNRASMSLTAKEPLDIVEVRDLTSTLFVNNNWCEDLTPYIEKWEGWNGLLPTARNMASVSGGKPYMIPQFFFVPALFVRTDVLKKLGVTEMPATLEDLFTLAAKITDPEKGQYGFAIRGKGNPFRQADLMILSNFANIDRTNFFKLSGGGSVYTDPVYLQSFKDYVNLFKNAVPSDGVNWGFNEQITSFVSGVTPFLMQDPDAVPLVDEYLTREQYTVIPMPVGKTSGVFYYEPGFTSFAIPPYSKYKDEAWDFITYLSSPERNAAICKVYGALPVNRSAYADDPYFSEGVFKAWDAILQSPDKYVTVRYPQTDERYAGWGQAHEGLMQSAFLGKITPEEAVAAWADYWK